MSDKEFSVCQFFPDGQYEYVRRNVSIVAAMKAFIRYTTNVASRMGITRRVIITDGGDCICMEWQADKGITFPPGAVGRKLRPNWESLLDEIGEFLPKKGGDAEKSRH